jgi:hypothetical protein
VVAIPINWDGSSGPVRVHAMAGLDDFAFDKEGNMYAGTNASNNKPAVKKRVMRNSSWSETLPRRDRRKSASVRPGLGHTGAPLPFMWR